MVHPHRSPLHSNPLASTPGYVVAFTTSFGIVTHPFLFPQICHPPLYTSQVHYPLHCLRRWGERDNGRKG
ncbi:hypothetical protein CsSME_00037199 [Camellia sinensis var. sinensis]